MKPLFEAKARYADQYALYKIYRIEPDKYKAELITDENGDIDSAAPIELVLSKTDGEWQTNDKTFEELGCILGIEIDVFNNGYGALLGRIGVE